jgi:hypothetical protein
MTEQRRSYYTRDKSALFYGFKGLKVIAKRMESDKSSCPQQFDFAHDSGH